MGIAKRKRNKTMRLRKSLVKPSARKKKKPVIHSMVDLVSANFEDGKSMREGYANVGISFDPNQSVSANANRLSATGVIPSRKELRELDYEASELTVPEDSEMSSWKEVMEIPEIKSKGRNVFLAPFERAYWQRLIAKHGSDYKAMSRDIKLNNYQHTERVCEKKCALFLEKYNDDLSRKTPAIRKREARKLRAAARALENPSSSSQPATSNKASASSSSKKSMAATNDSDDEDNDVLSESASQLSNESENGDILESLSDMSDLSEISGDEEEEEEEMDSDEEEFAPPPKKKFASVPAPKASSRGPTKKNVKSK